MGSVVVSCSAQPLSTNAGRVRSTTSGIIVAWETTQSWVSQFEAAPSTESIWKLGLPTYNKALKHVMLTLPKTQVLDTPGYFDADVRLVELPKKCPKTWVRYSLLRIDMGQETHWQETAAVEPANSPNVSMSCFLSQPESVDNLEVLKFDVNLQFIFGWSPTLFTLSNLFDWAQENIVDHAATLSTVQSPLSPLIRVDWSTGSTDYFW